MLGKLKVLVALGLALLLAYITAQNASLTKQVASLDSKLKKANAQIGMATGINDGLNATIDRLNRALQDERSAYHAMEKRAATMVATAEKQHEEIRRLLADEKEQDDSCSDRPLPGPVVDRLWQLYSDRSGVRDP